MAKTSLAPLFVALALLLVLLFFLVLLAVVVVVVVTVIVMIAVFVMIAVIVDFVAVLSAALFGPTFVVLVPLRVGVFGCLLATMLLGLSTRTVVICE
jgi:hypothetical protein